MTRARVLIVENDRVALIERRNSARGKHYFVFPGGGVEEGEPAHKAAAREVQEELGLEIEVGWLVAEVVYDGETHLYFRATILDGTFGSGIGLEMTGQTPPEAGTYKPVWKPIADLPSLTVYPRAVAQIIGAIKRCGWTHPPLKIIDPGEEQA